MDKSELIAKLKIFKKNIRRKYKINKLILFGSSAKGKVKEHSDVDLIAVGNYKAKGNINRAPPLYHEWHLAQKIIHQLISYATLQRSSKNSANKRL